MSIISWILLITGVWLTVMALITNTRNLISSVVYKVIPFFLGMSCFFGLALELGWITL